MSDEVIQLNVAKYKKRQTYCKNFGKHTSYTLLKLCMEKIVGKKMKIFSYVLTYDDPFHNSMHVYLIVYVSVFEIPTAVSLTSSCSVHVTTQRI